MVLISKNIASACMMAAALLSPALAAPTQTSPDVIKIGGGCGGGDKCHKPPKGNPGCNPIIRKEWRSMDSREQKHYIKAVTCLTQRPARSTGNVPGAVSRFDDFMGAHILETDRIHFVGFFQHWHRYFVWSYEKALREECGYRGAQPYWDWTLDAGNIVDSPLLTEDGFGGNGAFVAVNPKPDPRLSIADRSGGGCISNGPFKDLEVHLGPGNATALNKRCLVRDISQSTAARLLNNDAVQNILGSISDDTFAKFDFRVQGGRTADLWTYHAGGHVGVGGEMGLIADVYASPGDPLFYLHHANIDRIFWTWQSRSPARLQDVSGPITQFAPPFGDTANVDGETTLDFVMNFVGLAPNVAIREVMNIKDGALCYDYDRLA